MNKKDKDFKFYLVREDILPEAIKKTIRVKEILKRGEVRTIHDAVRMMDLSRSAYYKYKDFVLPFYDVTQGKLVTLSIILSDRPGKLSQVLNTVADSNGSILTINQGIPLQGSADVSISIETKEMEITVETLVERLGALSGVQSVRIIGQVCYIEKRIDCITRLRNCRQGCRRFTANERPSYCGADGYADSYKACSRKRYRKI